MGRLRPKKLRPPGGARYTDCVPLQVPSGYEVPLSVSPLLYLPPSPPSPLSAPPSPFMRSGTIWEEPSMSRRNSLSSYESLTLSPGGMLHPHQERTAAGSLPPPRVRARPELTDGGTWRPTGPSDSLHPLRKDSTGRWRKAPEYYEVPAFRTDGDPPSPVPPPQPPRSPATSRPTSRLSSSDDGAESTTPTTGSPMTRQKNRSWFVPPRLGRKKSGSYNMSADYSMTSVSSTPTTTPRNSMPDAAPPPATPISDSLPALPMQADSPPVATPPATRHSLPNATLQLLAPPQSDRGEAPRSFRAEPKAKFRTFSAHI